MQGDMLGGGKTSFTEAQKELAEAQIIERQKISDYDTREYPIEVLVDKFTKGLEDDNAEIYIPDYQREMIWRHEQKSRFIESILLNLPLPYLFTADDIDGRSEVVDGSQRIRTIVEFCQNQFNLGGLKLLDKLNSYSFSDLPLSRQRRFNKKTIRLIELTRDLDEEARRQMFDRLNSGGTNLKPMEQRIGSKNGPFSDLVKALSTNSKFMTLCPLSKTKIQHRENQELVLRFFAYTDRYKQFDHRVDKFLNSYLDDMNEGEFDANQYEMRFINMLDFVGKHFSLGFRKSQRDNSVPRIRFEAISVGSSLAIYKYPDLQPADVTAWITSKEFGHLTRSDASNSRPKVINRIHFVRDNLLGKDIEYEGDVSKIFNDPRQIDSNQQDFFGEEEN